MLPPEERGPQRALWLAAGILAFAAGAVGIALPLIPTVPFWLLAAFCFARSRPEWAERLYAHPRFGEPLRAWRDRRAIGRRAKVASLAAMTVGVGATWAALGWRWALVPLAVMAVTGPWIWTRAE